MTPDGFKGVVHKVYHQKLQPLIVSLFLHSFLRENFKEPM